MRKIKETVLKNTSFSYILFAISMSGFLSLYFMNYFSFIFLPLYRKKLTDLELMNKLIFSHISQSYIIVFSIIALMSIVTLVLIPLSLKRFNTYDRCLGLVACVSLIFLFFEFVISVLGNKMSGQFVFLLWLFFFVLILQIQRISRFTYSWLKGKEENEFDISKVTFVFGIIAVLLIILKR